MKLATWAYAASVALAAVLTIALGGLFQNIFERLFNGRPMPRLTELFFHLQWWVLLIALPFIGTAFRLTFRSTITTERAFAFAGLSTFVIVFLFALALVSLSLPFVTIIVSLE